MTNFSASIRHRLNANLPTNYAEQTHSSPYWIVRWPHQQRLLHACKIILRHRPLRLLDYGAGDCHLLEVLAARSPDWLPDQVVAYEPVSDYAEMALDRLEALGLQDTIEVERTLPGPDERFDFICCLSVLEHMPLLERHRFYSFCQDRLASGGRILVEVPSEVGPTLLVKELVRTRLKGRAPTYRPSQLLGCGLGRVQFDASRYDPTDTSTWIQWHSGFDYRLLADELACKFNLLETSATPFPRLPAWLGNQEVFFLAGNRSVGQT